MSSLLSTLTSYLPQHPGLLPQWFLFVSILAFGNSIQAYTTLTYTSRLYPLNPLSQRLPFLRPTTPLAPNSTVTPLQARTFGTWTLIQTMVRLYAAYNISDARFYQMAFLTYVVAAGHFGSEWLWFGTTRMGKPLMGPVVVSLGSLVWMWVQWGFYVEA